MKSVFYSYEVLPEFSVSESALALVTIFAISVLFAIGVVAFRKARHKGNE